MDTKPVVTKVGILSMQVCVRSEWSDEEILRFAEAKNPCGTKHGWGIRKEGDKLLEGAPERNPCSERRGFVHVMLDA
jgi:hypothetical protein